VGRSALLERLGVTTDRFAALAVAHPDDADPLAGLRARGVDEERLRRWSDRFEETWNRTSRCGMSTTVIRSRRRAYRRWRSRRSASSKARSW